MHIQTDRKQRYSGRATELPTARAFLDALAACMMGERAQEPLRISYEVAAGGDVQTESIDLIIVNAVEFHPMAEHMSVAALDSSYEGCILHLRRTHAMSDVLLDYIEIY